MSLELDFELLSTADPEPEPFFSWAGCDITTCGAHNLGADVYPVRAYKTLAEAQADPDGNLYEFNICDKCLYEHEYGPGSYGA